MTALEIFSNPYDLQILTYQPSEASKNWAFSITRGPGHEGKPLLSAQPIFATHEEAVKAIKGVLGSIRQFAEKELGNPASATSLFLNPERAELDQTKVLTEELIARILTDIKEKNAASTYTYDQPAPTGGPATPPTTPPSP